MRNSSEHFLKMNSCKYDSTVRDSPCSLCWGKRASLHDKQKDRTKRQCVKFLCRAESQSHHMSQPKCSKFNDFCDGKRFLQEHTGHE